MDCIGDSYYFEVQEEELEALSAIYGDEMIKAEKLSDGRLKYDVNFDESSCITVYIPQRYPSKDELPCIEFRNTRWSDLQKTNILKDLVRNPIS